MLYNSLSQFFYRHTVSNVVESTAKLGFQGVFSHSERIPNLVAVESSLEIHNQLYKEMQ